MPRDDYNVLAARIHKTGKESRKERAAFEEFLRRNEAAKAKVKAALDTVQLTKAETEPETQPEPAPEKVSVA